MPYNKNWMSIIFVLLVTLTFTGCSKKTECVIVIEGSTSACPVMKIIADRYISKNDVAFDIHCNGSKKGISGLIKEECNIAASSSKISSRVLDSAGSKGIKIKEFVFAYDIIIPIVNLSNPIENLSLEQLKSIYEGSIQNWIEVGGKPGKIMVVTRDDSSGTRGRYGIGLS